MPTLTLLLARFTRTAWPLFLPALGVTKFLFLFPTRTTQGDRIFRATLFTCPYHIVSKMVPRNTASLFIAFIHDAVQPELPPLHPGVSAHASAES